MAAWSMGVRGRFTLPGWPTTRLLGGIFVAHDVEDGAILNVGAGADADVVDVAADYRAGPDAGVGADDDVADDYGGGVNVSGGGDFGALAAIGSDHCIPVIGAGLLKGRLGMGTGVSCPYMPSRVNWNDNIWVAGITRNGLGREKLEKR